MSPFLANKGYDPPFDLTPTSVSQPSFPHPEAKSLVSILSELHEFLRSQIAAANKASKVAYDRKHTEAPPFE
ncbi:hypothetical protein OC861_007020, partial [Tilletia horrida]